MTYTQLDCEVEEVMFDVGLKKTNLIKKKMNLELRTIDQKRTVIDDGNCSETSVTANLPQLNDPTMTSLGTKVMVVLLLQYSQQWQAQDQLEA